MIINSLMVILIVSYLKVLLVLERDFEELGFKVTNLCKYITTDTLQML